MSDKNYDEILLARVIFKLQEGKSSDDYVLVSRVKINYEKQKKGIRGSLIRFFSGNSNFDFVRKSAGKHEIRVNPQSKLMEEKDKKEEEKVVEKPVIISTWEHEEFTGGGYRGCNEEGKRFQVFSDGSFDSFSWVSGDGCGGGSGFKGVIEDEKVLEQIREFESAGEKEKIYEILINCPNGKVC